MGPFVSQSTFPIVVKYIEKENKAGLPMIVVVRSADTESRYKDHVKTITTLWMLPNWKQSNELIRKATKFDADAGERRLDWQMYRGMLLENFMKEWDIKGSDGKVVPCTKEFFDQLDINIASTLIDEFLMKTSPSEEELGN